MAAKGAPTLVRRPPWRSWRTASRAARCIRWIEELVPVPSGPAHGRRWRLAGFQREIIEVLLAPGVRTAGLQIGAGNAKSSLAAAVGLWALADEPDSPQVPLVAFNAQQATRTLFNPMRQMVRQSAELQQWLKIRLSNQERGIESPWNGGMLWPLPADDERLQGLNPSIAIVDEAEFVDLPVWQALEDRLGKRSESLLLAAGTPGPNRECVLWHLRSLAGNGAPIAWVEFSAPAGCDIADETAWEAANPALKAGFLARDVFERAVEQIRVAADSVRPVLEARFRLFRLGQWVDAPEDGWLPAGAWEACPHREPARPGSPVVVAVDGTWRRSTAIVAATVPDGSLFLVWAGEQVSDEELDERLRETLARWDVVEVVVNPRTRKPVADQLRRDGVPVVDLDVSSRAEQQSSAAFYEAVLGQRVVHDHHPLIGDHLRNVVVATTGDQLRLARRDDSSLIDAAMAAKAAWWAVVQRHGQVLERFVW